MCATLFFHLASHVLHACQRKSVSIDIFESCRYLSVAGWARFVMKVNSPITPLVAFGKHIVCKKGDAGTLSDQRLFPGTRPWRGKHKHRRSVRWRHCQPAVTRFESDCQRQVESQVDPNK